MEFRCSNQRQFAFLSDMKHQNPAANVSLHWTGSNPFSFVSIFDVADGCSRPVSFSFAVTHGQVYPPPIAQVSNSSW